MTASKTFKRRHLPDTLINQFLYPGVILRDGTVCNYFEILVLSLVVVDDWLGLFVIVADAVGDGFVICIVSPAFSGDILSCLR